MGKYGGQGEGRNEKQGEGAIPSRRNRMCVELEAEQGSMGWTAE